MKKIWISAMVAVALFICSKCEKDNEFCHKTITFFNESAKDIYVIGSADYPDTMHIIHGPSPKGKEFINGVPAQSSSDRPLQQRDCYESIFSYGKQIPSDTLMVFVFDADVIESVDWLEIVQSNMILKRYDLSLEDLQQSGFTITYPPR